VHVEQHDLGANGTDALHRRLDVGGLADHVHSVRHDYAATTSPIFVERTTSARITAQLVDGPTGAPVAGAGVELCRAASPQVVCHPHDST
jgi:hypothetical protein